MKKILFLVLIISLIIISCTQQKEVKSPYEGVWKVVSWESIAGDSLAWKYPGTFTGSEMTIIAKNHFLWGGTYKRDTTIINNWGGGTYILNGNQLEVSFLYCVDQTMVGTKRKMLLEIKNDSATYSWPCDENWQVNKGKYYVQKLVRAE